jgi:Na+/melibiose symporter-like transporter
MLIEQIALLTTGLIFITFFIINMEKLKSLVSQLEREQAELQGMLVNGKLNIANDHLEFND